MFSSARFYESDAGRGRNRAAWRAARASGTALRPPEMPSVPTRTQIPGFTPSKTRVAGFETRVSNANTEFLNRVPGAVKGRSPVVFRGTGDLIARGDVGGPAENRRRWTRTLLRAARFPERCGRYKKLTSAGARAPVPGAAAQTSPFRESGVRCGVSDGTFAGNRATGDAF